MESGEPLIGKIEHEVRSDGGKAWSYTTKLPFRNSKNEVVGICGINKGFTRLKETEDRLQRTNEELNAANQRLKEAQAQLIDAEKAQLAARLAFGVAHEVRNPLNIRSKCGPNFSPTCRH